MRDLRKLGWRVFRLWECEIENNPDKVLKSLTRFLTSNAQCPKR